MKYPIGAKPEYIYPEDHMYAVLPWKGCVLIGESSSGNPVVESDDGDIFQVKAPDLLRPAKVRTVWWSRYVIDTNGTPFAIPFSTSRKWVNEYDLICGEWH